MSPPTLQKWYPHLQSPVVVSAPMLGVSNGKLAAAVSEAGGLGFIPGGSSFEKGSVHYTALSKSLQDATERLAPKEGELLKVGVGMITCSPPSFPHFETSTVPLLEGYRVSALWLFAPAPPNHEGNSIHEEFVKKVRGRGEWGQKVKVWVQVGTVAAARQAVRDGVDVVVAQGVDAGGHQFAAGAGTVGLVPEAVDAVQEEAGKMGREVVVVAAGGITDGRGVFVVAHESDAQGFKKKNLINANDGGVSTVKSNFHDDIQSTTIWPRFYDGRGLINPGYIDLQSGVSMDENLKRFKEAKESGDMSRMVTWS
ncbi:hypothetical protein MKZ38_005166 [Zalerion maritima]|uniref:Nitronate monooxygenase domain-containing protein n=1 Tax=Zalerion maritima TaxID=339359 RepID=A0AAD5WUV3_9PEZI|nr:hypothetical protein MKZ38_005166 [Zalerion maritima]